MKSESYKRLRKFLNPKFAGKFWGALLEAVAEGDSFNESNIIAAKQNLFIATAEGQYLERLFARLGVIKPAGVGIDDDLFRELGIKQTNLKLITNIFLDIYETFYGSDAVRASSQSGVSESYQLYDGLTLIIQVDTNSKPLTITFKTEDFESISTATAAEVAAVITRQAFNAGYTLYAEPSINFDDGKLYVQISSGTRGPKSSVTIIGGSAQNIFKFSSPTLATPKVGTVFTPSFVDQYIRFTWTSGPDPQITYVDPGDYVNLFGENILESNRGSFVIENVAGGIVGEAYFEIINPNFQIQAPIVLTGIAGASGGGTITRSVPIVSSPVGLSRSSNLVTVTTVINHDLQIGNIISIDDAENASFNGRFNVTSITPTTFTYIQNGPNALSGAGMVLVSTSIIASPMGAVRSTATGQTTLTTDINHAFSPGQIVTVDNVTDSSFNGQFTIVSVTATTVTYTQDAAAEITFFKPFKQSLQRLPRYATIYAVNPYEIVAFLPATSNIVKRDLFGSWHLNPSVPDSQFLGSYLYNTKTGFSITRTQTRLNDTINEGQVKTVLFGQKTQDFPDQEGFLVFEYGTSNQEGPVKYLARPSSGSWLIDPSYKFKKSHASGSDVSEVYQRSPYQPKIDGSDYQAYVTGTIKGRVEAINMTNALAAAGITVNIVIVYPKGPGLASIENVYGEDLS